MEDLVRKVCEASNGKELGWTIEYKEYEIEFSMNPSKVDDREREKQVGRWEYFPHWLITKNISENNYEVLDNSFLEELLKEQEFIWLLEEQVLLHL